MKTAQQLLDQADVLQAKSFDVGDAAKTLTLCPECGAAMRIAARSERDSSGKRRYRYVAICTSETCGNEVEAEERRVIGEDQKTNYSDPDKRDDSLA